MRRSPTIPMLLGLFACSSGDEDPGDKGTPPVTDGGPADTDLTVDTDTPDPADTDDTDLPAEETAGPAPDAPVAVDDAATVDEGGVVVIALLDNDSDDDGLDPAAIRITADPATGEVTLGGDGTATYTHGGGEDGADSFAYEVRDVTGVWSNVATVDVTVLGVADPPVAVDDAATLVVGGAVRVDVVANDSDPDGAIDPASVVVVSAPAVGTVTVLADGTVDYTHDGSGVLADSFTYTVEDTTGATSNVATVTVSTLPPLGCGKVVLDPSFAGDGTVNLVTPGTDYDDGAHATALQADGKRVLGGKYYRTAYGRTATVTRIDASGALDPAFDGDGFAEDLFRVDSAVYGLGVQSDDAIVGAGALAGDLLVFRLLPDGSFDGTFGVGGSVTLPTVDVHYDAHEMLAIQPDGKLVAAGTVAGDFAVARFLADGSLDGSFGIGGVATLDLGGADTAYTLLLQPDGRIVVGGTTDGDFGLVRFDVDGAPDLAFGAGGVAVLDVTGKDDQAYGLALDGTDIVAVGCGDCSFDYLYDAGFALARFDGGGVPDATFGAGGAVYDPIPAGILAGTGHNDRAYAVSVLAGGALLVAGQAQWNDGAGRMLVARYLADGSVDPCFDGDGYYPQNAWDVFAQSDVAHAVDVAPDGSFTVVGTTNPSAFGYQAVLRALP